MAEHNEIGKEGERIALGYLLSKGYVILESNWRYRRAEIDIIAKTGDILVFLEVKSRTNDRFGKPEEFVNQRKEELMMSAAQAYMLQINHTWEIRFDIISILLIAGQQTKVEHFEDVFF